MRRTIQRDNFSSKVEESEDVPCRVKRSTSASRGHWIKYQRWVKLFHEFRWRPSTKAAQLWKMSTTRNVPHVTLITPPCSCYTSCVSLCFLLYTRTGTEVLQTNVVFNVTYEGVSKRFRTESITKYMLTTINTH
jgi:hypothetical protein